jgi:hypothetical protein
MNWKIRILSLATAIVIGVISWAAGAVHGQRAAERSWSHHSVMLLGAHNDALPVGEVLFVQTCCRLAMLRSWRWRDGDGDARQAGSRLLAVGGDRTVTKAEKLVFV